MRWLRRILLLLMLCGLIGGGWLLHSQSGLLFVLARLSDSIPGLSIEGAGGSIAGGVSIPNLHFQQDGLQLRAESMHMRVSLAALLLGRVHVLELRVGAMDLILPAARPAAASAASAGAVPDLPRLRVDRLSVDGLRVSEGATEWLRFDQIEGSFASSGRGAAVRGLRVVAGDARLLGDLSLDLGAPWPLRGADLRFDWPLAGNRYRGSLRADSARSDLHLDEPLVADLSLVGRPGAQARVDVVIAPQTPDLVGQAIAADLQLQLDGAAFELDGKAQFASHEIRSLSARGRIETEQLRLDGAELALGADRGRIQLTAIWPRLAGVSTQVSARFERVFWPLPDGGEWVVDGAATWPIDGRAGLQLDLSLAREGWPIVLVRGAVLDEAEHWRSESLSLQSGGAEATLDFVWPKSFGPVHIRGDWRGIDPAFVHAEFPGSLNGKVVLDGDYQADGLSGDARIEGVSGTLRGQTLSAEGQVRLVRNRLDLALLSMDSGRNTLRIGRPGAEAPVDVDLQAPDLHGLWPGLSGSARARLAWLERGDFTLEAEGSDLRQDGQEIGEWRANMRWSGDPLGPLELDVRARRLHIAGQALDRLDLAASGSRRSAQVDLNLERGVRGLESRWALAEGEHKGHWLGQIRALEIRDPDLPFQLARPADLSWAPTQVRLVPACLVSAGEGRLCLRAEGAPDDWQLVAELVALDLGPLSRLAASRGFAAESRLSGEIAARFQSGALTEAHARLASPEGALRSDERPDLDLGYRELGLELDWMGAAGSWSLQADLRPEGRLRANGRLDQVAGLVHHVGDMSLDVHRFDAIEAFTSQLASPRGDMSGSLHFESVAGEPPRFSGSLAITGFATEVPELGLVLKDGSLAIAGVADRIIVRGAIASGAGYLVLDGLYDPAADSTWSFALSGDKVSLADTPSLRLTANPALRLTRDRREWVLSGQLHIASAKIDAAELAPPDTRSDDVVLVSTEERGEVTQTPWRADVSIGLGEEVRLTGYGFDGHVTGGLRVLQKRGENAFASGQLNVTGRYAAYGQRLQVRRGQLLYANSPLDAPTLDIEAEREVGDTRAGIRIGGNAQEPETSIYARPPAPESEALALLVTGRPLRRVAGSDASRLSTAALALGTVGGDLLARSLGAEIGVTGDARRGTEAFTIGKYLTPRLYIGYGVGLVRSGQVFLLRYRIREDLELEAASGEQAKASLNYQIER